MGDDTIADIKGLNKLSVIYKGVFDFKSMYKFLYEWLSEEGFVADGPASGDDMFESFYWQRKNAQGITDYNMWWRMKKTPEEQSSTWILYKMSLDFLGIAMSQTEIMHEGKKIKAYKGEMNFFITPTLIIDPDNKWDKSSFASKFSSVFKNRTYRKEIKFHKDTLEDIAFRLQEDIKAFLGLVTMKDHGEPFHPEKGYNL